MKVSILGMGRMGAAMARRLAGGDFEVTVWNRSHETARTVANATGAAMAVTAAAAAAQADVVVSSLADDAAIEAVHTGPDGTLKGIGEGTVVLETSTVDPDTVRRLAERFREAGAHLLDAPVSGSVALVEQGTLTAMVGGDPEALERARPVLERLTKAVFHLGDSGAGATMKLAVNSLVHATNLAIAEALVLAEAAGVDRHKAYEVFAASAVASPFLLYKREGFEHPESAPVAFSLDLVGKDLDLILGLAHRSGAPMPQLEVTAETTAAAIATGRGSEDMAAVAEFLRLDR
jgi:3-hydroxyisobutyrate dehydrogenase-like beta-hydroxyacid dehydrogenase